MKTILPVLLFLFYCNTQAQETASIEPNSLSNDIYYFSSDTIKSDTVRNKKGEILKEVIIPGNKHQVPVTAVRSGLKTMDNPQSVQVIGSQIIEQQQAIRLSEVVKNVNGVYVGSARGGAQESFYSRGYDMGANNMFKNGFRFSSGTIPETSSLERVEVLKGSAALLYGNVAPGGIMNMVTKAPKFKNGGEISMQAGSYSYFKPTVDFYGPLNKYIAFRVIGSYENSESFRDVVKNERYYINPSFLFKVNDQTNITLQGDYLNYDWTPDFGTGIIGKEFAKVPRNTFFGALWGSGKTRQTSVSALINHDINENWKMNFNTSLQNTDRASKSIERVQPDLNGDWNRPLGQSANMEQIIAEQLSFQGNFNTGSIKHNLFTGADFDNTFANSDTFAFNEKSVLVNGKYVGNLYDSINIFNFDPSTQRMDSPEATNTKTTKTTTNRFGVFAQDLISLTDQIKFLAGIRWSWQESQVDTYDLTKVPVVYTEGAKVNAQAFSPKVGLIYQPTTNTSIFASYANSFTPNSGFTVNSEPIKPSIIDQYEVGLKQDFLKELFSTNITVYQIKNSNLAQMAEFQADGITPNSDSNVKTLNGETKSKGVEIDITARPIEGLSLMAGYSYNDMRYSKTSGLVGSTIQGDRLARTPKNTANFSAFYKAPTGKLKGITVGALAYYIGNRLGGWNNQWAVDPNNTNNLIINSREIPLDGYLTVDCTAGYEWNKVSLLCKLSNVTNEINYTVHENYSANPIAPRQVMAILKYKF